MRPAPASAAAPPPQPWCSKPRRRRSAVKTSSHVVPDFTCLQVHDRAARAARVRDARARATDVGGAVARRARRRPERASARGRARRARVGDGREVDGAGRFVAARQPSRERNADQARRPQPRQRRHLVTSCSSQFSGFAFSEDAVSRCAPRSSRCPPRRRRFRARMRPASFANALLLSDSSVTTPQQSLQSSLSAKPARARTRRRTALADPNARAARPAPSSQHCSRHSGPRPRRAPAGFLPHAGPVVESPRGAVICVARRFGM